MFLFRRRRTTIACIILLLAAGACGRDGDVDCTAEALVDEDGTSYSRDASDGCKFKDRDGNPPPVRVDRATSTTTTASTTTTGVSPPAAAEDGDRTLSVSPASGPASAESTIEVTGTHCSRSARFWINEDGGEKEGAQFADADAQGTWKGRLNIDDEDSPTKSYEVAAECYDGPGVVRFTYRSVPLEVRP